MQDTVSASMNKIKQAKDVIRKIPLLNRLAPQSQALEPPVNAKAAALVTGMTSLEEQAYFRNYAQNTYSGAGEIVDLGCWLGSTTIPLAQGMRNNKRAHGKFVHAYDQFKWQAWMNSSINKCSKQYNVGDSFLDEYVERTRDYSDIVKIYPGDITQIGWNGQPIEFLLVDLMKSWSLAEYVVKTFYPCLIPGKSVLLHQDFKHQYTSWIHLIQYKLRDYFSLEVDLSGSSSTAFRLIRPIDCDLSWLSDLMTFSDDEVSQAFQYSLSLVKHKSSNIAAAHVMYFIHLNRKPKARRLLNKYIDRGFSVTSDLARCQTLLESQNP